MYTPANKFNEILDTVSPVFFRRRNVRTGLTEVWSDNIIAFDIETVNLYQWKDGTVTGFEYSLPPERYQDATKMGFMIVWQLCVDGQIVVGRRWDDFIDVLKHLREHIGADLIIYIHNLGFEFQFMRNVIEDFQIFAREARRPMYARSPSLGVEFRCSQMLTNAKLEDVPKLFHLDVKKAVGKWDYDVVRTPETPLTDDEIEYISNDVLVLDALIRQMRDIYKHVQRIPLTNTSRLRKECNALYKDKFWTKKKIADLNEDDPKMYARLKACFSGGYTHANAAYVGKICKQVASFDEASSYPAQMCGRMFPWGQFQPAGARSVETMKETFAYILHIRLTNVTSRLQNHYLSFSKCMKRRNVYCDNGRIIMAGMLELWCTDVDMRIIQTAYMIGKIEFLEAWCAPYRYLDTTYVKFILDLYGQKTALKGLEEFKRAYDESKVKINSAYGMMVTDTVRDDVVFEGNEWKKNHVLDAKEIAEALQRAKNPNRCFLSYAHGVWVTAWGRHAIWKIITSPGCDEAIIYDDTDSIKYDVERSAGAVEAAIDAYNKEIREDLRRAMIWHDLPQNSFSPKDRKGIEHPMGVFEKEDVYEEFITLGAKKYAYKLDGQIHTTVAGVAKEYLGKDGRKHVYLKDLKEFKTGKTWGYKVSGRTTAYYPEDQPVVTVQGHTFTERFGVCIMPTEYTLGVTDEFRTYFRAAQQDRDHTVATYIEKEMIHYVRND